MTKESRVSTYRLVARIMSKSANGYHFTTITRTSDDLIYSVDGMTQHKDIGIRQISDFNSLGCAIHMNSSKNKNAQKLEKIVGRHKHSTTVFYVLENTEIAKAIQQKFWILQYQKLYEAMDLGPFLLNEKGDVKFGSFNSRFLNGWISCSDEDITWTENFSKLSSEFKVSIL